MILKTQNRRRVEFFVCSEVERSFFSYGCARNKLQVHTVLKNSEVISLDDGLRMGGIPALDLWDLFVEVLHSSPNHLRTGQLVA